MKKVNVPFGITVRENSRGFFICLPATDDYAHQWLILSGHLTLLREKKNVVWFTEQFHEHGSPMLRVFILHVLLREKGHEVFLRPDLEDIIDDCRDTYNENFIESESTDKKDQAADEKMVGDEKIPQHIIEHAEKQKAICVKKVREWLDTFEKAPVKIGQPLFFFMGINQDTKHILNLSCADNVKGLATICIQQTILLKQTVKQIVDSEDFEAIAHYMEGLKYIMR